MARVVAALTRRFGDLDIAEEAAAEGDTTAVKRWPADGVPPDAAVTLGVWLASDKVVAADAVFVVVAAAARPSPALTGR
jgi:predicted RNA polymerase sigma factor